jgi:hypothetical protein
VASNHRAGYQGHRNDELWWLDNLEAGIHTKPERIPDSPGVRTHVSAWSIGSIVGFVWACFILAAICIAIGGALGLALTSIGGSG